MAKKDPKGTEPAPPPAEASSSSSSASAPAQPGPLSNRVEATQDGFYKSNKIPRGTTFTLRDPKDFSARWMKRVDESTPDDLARRTVPRKPGTSAAPAVKPGGPSSPPLGTAPPAPPASSSSSSASKPEKSSNRDSDRDVI